MRARIDVGACAALLLVCAACARDERPRSLHADLIALFPVTDAARERGTIDLGTPAGDALLRGGWTPGATLDDGSTVAWAIERRSSLRFTITEPAPRRVRLSVRQSADVASPADRRSGTPVLVELNGHRVGRIEVGGGAGAFDLPLPVTAQRAGDNVLELQQPTIGGTARDGPSDRPRNALAYDAIAITRDDGHALAVAEQTAADGGAAALLLPPASELRYFVRAPRAAELRLAHRRAAGPGTATLQVRVQRDGERAAYATELSSSDAVQERRLGLVGATDGEVVQITLRAAGDAPVRLDAAALESVAEGSRHGVAVAVADAAVVTGAAVAASAAARASDAGAGDGADATRAAAAAPPNVLLYVIDTLRADHLGCYGYDRPTSPRIDAFAEGAVTFTRALAQAPWTRPSVASLLTGLEPEAHGASALRRKLAPDVTTLAEILRAHGYATAAFVTNANVAGRLGFDRGFETFVDFPEDHARASLHVPSSEVNVAVRAWLARRDRSRPFFLYVHASDPHAPYTPAPEVLARFQRPGDPAPPDVRTLRTARDATADAAGVRDPSVFPAAPLRALTAAYDAEIAQNDASFGALLDELQSSGLAATTLVVLTSDHGEELGEHGDLEHGHSLHDELLHVPLIVRLPAGRRAGERHAGLVQHVDVLPTVLAVVGTGSAPPGLTGRALFAATAPPDPRIEVRSHTEFGARELRSLATDAWKAVQVIDAPRGRHGVTLYDRTDPGERHDVAARHPVLVGYAQQALETAHRAAALRVRAVPLVDRETAARLRALGYAE